MTEQRKEKNEPSQKKPSFWDNLTKEAFVYQQLDLEEE